MSIESFDLFPPDKCLAFIILGKGFLGELVGCILSLLLVEGLHVTGRDSPPGRQSAAHWYHHLLTYLLTNNKLVTNNSSCDTEDLNVNEMILQCRHSNENDFEPLYFQLLASINFHSLFFKICMKVPASFWIPFLPPGGIDRFNG